MEEIEELSHYKKSQISINTTNRIAIQSVFSYLALPSSPLRKMIILSGSS